MNPRGAARGPRGLSRTVAHPVPLHSEVPSVAYCLDIPRLGHVLALVGALSVLWASLSPENERVRLGRQAFLFLQRAR